MAENKYIGELPAALNITDDDLFVVEQDGVAKQLSGTVMKQYTLLDIISAMATTLEPGASATATYNPQTKVISLGIPKGEKGDKGDKGNKGDKGDTGNTGPQGNTGATGNGVQSVTLVGGTHLPGGLDTYRITYTNGATFDFQVYNGADGTGAGDMTKYVYDNDNAVATAGGIADYIDDNAVGIDTGLSVVNGKLCMTYNV